MPTLSADGYKFDGWYTQNGTSTSVWGTQFTGATAVTADITLYAKCTEKAAVSITETAQVYGCEDTSIAYKIKGKDKNLSGFTVEYLVNNIYTETAPSDIGKYNVKITRAEDDTYKAYSKEITNGLQIKACCIDNGNGAKLYL